MTRSRRAARGGWSLGGAMRAVLAVSLGLFGVGCMPTVPQGGLISPWKGHGDSGLVVRAEGAAGDCEREVLGLVSVSAPVEDPSELLFVLRERAAALGGDRVVDLAYRRDDQVHTLSGMAARCSRLLVGRDYLVIRRVSVTATADSPAEAYAALVEKARTHRGGLVVDVDYQHARDQLRLTGHVARYVAHGTGVMTLPDGAYERAGPEGPLPPAPKRPKPAAKPGVRCAPTTDENGSLTAEPGRCELQF